MMSSFHILLCVRQNLKLRSMYDGFLFLAESVRNPPILRSHHHIELELNIVANGTVTYIVGGERFSFGPRTLFWLFPPDINLWIAQTTQVIMWRFLSRD